jgi:hypothetical protein
MKQRERIVTTGPRLGAVAALVSTTGGPDLEPANASATSTSKATTAASFATKEKAKARGRKDKSIEDSDQENERNIDGQSIIAKGKKEKDRRKKDR